MYKIIGRLAIIYAPYMHGLTPYGIFTNAFHAADRDTLGMIYVDIHIARRQLSVRWRLTDS